MGKFEANLPSVLEPVGDICVQVTIPAHPDYVKLFVRAVRMLEVNRMYARDENLSAKIVCAQWRDRTVNPLIEALATGTGACGVDGECLAYPPFASFISYFPQNPYTDPDLVPDGFLAPPFYVNGKDAEHTLPTHETGDVIVDFSAINLEPSWDLDKTPRIELCLSGSGVCELHLLNIVQGGVAIISLDNPVDLGDIIAGIIDDDLKSIDLNQDIISLPPESAEEIIIEVEVPTEGDHIIYVYFLPTVNDSLIPLAFGGGLREISLCGNLRPCGQPAPEPPPPLEGVTELKPEFQFTADCGLEMRYRNQDNEIISDWEAVPGWIENFADCVGGMNMSMDYDQLMEAVAAGIYKAANNIAKQVVSGRTTDFVVGEDGAVSSPTTDDGVDVPVDDPETPEIDESLAARAGGVQAVRLGFQEMLKRLDGFHAASMPDTVAQYYMEQLFKIADTEDLLLAIQIYYNYRTVPNAAYTIPTSLDAEFYCAGLTLGTMTAWALDVPPDTLDDMFINLYRCVSDEQIAEWFAKGLPTSVYQTYPCTPIADEQFTLDMSLSNNPSYTTYGIWKGLHRFEITIEGSYVDSDDPNIVGDAFYFHNLTSGVKTFSNMGIAVAIGSLSGVTQAQVPWNAAHKYTFTVDFLSSGGAQAATFSRDNGVMAIPNVSGTLTIKVKDLGEYAL